MLTKITDNFYIDLSTIVSLNYRDNIIYIILNLNEVHQLKVIDENVENEGYAYKNLIDKLHTFHTEILGQKVETV